MALLPALRVTVVVAVAQVSHEPVGAKASVPAAAPLTVRVMGRFAVVPLAYRKVSVAGPALAALTVHCTYEPTSLAVLTKPVPVKPGQLDSTAPWKMVAFSASYVVADGGAEVPLHSYAHMFLSNR